jgi:thioredoxin-related protein
MKKILIPLIILLSLQYNLQAQNTGKINWYTIEEAVEMTKKIPKKIFIDVYTDWCGWCKKMEAETFAHPEIAKILNENYYPVKLNSETTDTIHFNGYTFINEGTGRRSAHQFSIALLQGKMSYPSIAYMSENLQMITVVPGYMTPEAIEPVLKFIAENHYLKTSYDEFQKNFTSSIVNK